MLVVHIQIRVKPEAVAAFIEATRINAEVSIREPGIARFDFVQSTEDPTAFVLVEAYRTEEAPAQHKATPHYAVWRDTVAPMMAVPRQSFKYHALHLPA
ncbi:MAG TPA: antibiotic biosynthesis monooxygenase [Candidatus Limnocylindria bacterium]|jgi:quinol monooxygenase YgiN|nr:antibiotic biosynthesis monooxygenase [Candidatus Limnocylindria bacterium]